MKKIAMLMVILVLATAAFAAAKPAGAPAKTQGGITAISLNSAPNVPSIRFDFGSWSLDAGVMLINTAAGNTFTLLGRGEVDINKIGSNIRTYWAPAITLVSPPAGGSTTNLSVFLGAEYMFAPQLAIFFDLTAFTLTSSGGTTSWGIGANQAQIYSGGRLYL